MKKLPLLHNVLIRILLNTVTYLTGGQDPHFAYEKECKTFISYLEECEIPETDVHARLACKQVKAYFDIRLGNIDKGTETLKQIISLYKDLGADNLAFESSNYLQILLEKQST